MCSEAKFLHAESSRPRASESYHDRKTGIIADLNNVRVFKGLACARCGATVTARERSGGLIKPQFPLGARKGACGGPRLESQRRRHPAG